MNHCRDCKQWVPLDADGLGIGNCQLAQNVDGWGGPRGKRTLAFATGEDPHGRWANLRTLPTFGCVQWEKKEGQHG